MLLDISPQVAQQLIARKAPRDYTRQGADLQEADSTHLVRTRKVYLELARTNSAWRCVSCMRGEQLRMPDEIEIPRSHR